MADAVGARRVVAEVNTVAHGRLTLDCLRAVVQPGRGVVAHHECAGLVVQPDDEPRAVERRRVAALVGHGLAEDVALADLLGCQGGVLCCGGHGRCGDTERLGDRAAQVERSTATTPATSTSADACRAVSRS